MIRVDHPAGRREASNRSEVLLVDLHMSQSHPDFESAARHWLGRVMYLADLSNTCSLGLLYFLLQTTPALA
jgi:hypothetical protein